MPMEQQTANALLKDKTIGEIKGKFFVPSYQRGYRWTEHQVQTILNDLWESHGKHDAGGQPVKYCLQPVVVRKRGESEYELIDGQQRFTTIFILLNYLKQQGMPLQIEYTIDYETRKETAKFLGNINKSDAEKNIDFFHVFEAYTTIDEWFKSKFSSENDMFYARIDLGKYLHQQVVVIWYEVGPEEDPVALFTRLNIGRIQLTNAELVRALLLRGDDRQQQQELTSLWDTIENQLRDHHDEFWYFLTRKSPARYPSRIELLFDMMAKRKDGEKEQYHTFFWFEREIKEKGIGKVGEEMEQTFLRLKEWYRDDTLYHKIGYLIASGQATMPDLLDALRNKRKSEIMELLDKRIASSINFSMEAGKTYSDLSYDKNYQQISRLLLLFNVQSLIDSSGSYQRFPFGLYNTAVWSLEHIHAQHSKGLNTTKVRLKWIELHKQSVEELSTNGDNQSLIQEMTDVLNSKKIESAAFEDLLQRVCKVLSEKNGDTSYIHTISNMALLTVGENAALNNTTFDVKRRSIIDMDKKGDFIPYCTKNVFLKYYTKQADAQTHFWSEADRKAYIEQMETTLSPYLARIGKSFKEQEDKNKQNN